MFDRLLLSKGGGIVLDAQKAEQSDRAIIAIGLGGTGINCLKTLKEEVYDRVKPDAGSDSSLPKYRRFKFLAIDTDDIDDIFDDSEQCKIRQDSISTILDNRESYVTNNPSLKWLGTKAQMAPRNNVGAGGVRQIGRLCLFRNSESIIEKLKSMISDATTVELGQNHNPPEIYFQIFTGMCGGTGSGCFLDMCYLIRGILNELGMSNNNNHKLLGYFFLPDFNDDGTEYKQVNGYAALKELDYCMNYYHNGDEWNQDYQGLAQPVKTDKPPVDYAHIISKRNTQNAQTDNPQEVTISAVVDYVLEYMTKTASNVNQNAQDDQSNDGTQEQGQSTNNFDIISHLSNINQLINGTNKNYGSNYNYCIIGASRAYLPYKEINTYAAAQVFAKFKYLKDNVPSEPNVIDFLSIAKLKLEDIENDVKEGLPDFTPPDASWEELQQALNAGLIVDESSFPPCINNVGGGKRLIRAETGASIRENSLGIIEQNKEALKGTRGGYVNGNHSIKSLVDRIRKEIEGVLRDPNKGPYYASSLLSGNNEINIKTKIIGFIEDIERKIRNAELTYTDRIDKVNESINHMREVFPRRFGLGVGQEKIEAADSYISSIVEMLKQERETVVLQAVRDVLLDLNNGKLDSIVNEFRKYTYIFDDLYETFDENIRNINAMSNASLNQSVIKIVDINDPIVRQFLDNQVNEKIGNGRDMVSGYISGMIAAEEKADKFEEKEIVDYTKQFFRENLRDITDYTLSKYFEIKFQTTNSASLVNNIEGVYVNQIGSASTPYMWLNSIDETSHKETGFITYPQDAVDVGTAVQNYQRRNSGVFSTTNQANIRASYLTDSISIFRFICGVPLFNYNGQIYRRAYEGGLLAGTHLYEYTDDRQKIDFRNLKTIIPLRALKQINTYENDQEKNNNEDFINELDNYFDKIVKIDPVSNEKFLKKYDEDKLAAYEHEIAALEKGEKELSDTDLGIRIQDEVSIISEESPIITADRSSPSQIDNIIKDIIYSSMVHETGAKRQIENYKRYEDLKSRFKKIEAGVSNLKDFVNIYSRGLITKDQDELHKLVINYIDNNDYEQIVELSNARNRYGENFELYSAYITYNSLEENIKNSITDYIDTKLKGKVDSDSTLLSNELETTKENINKRIKSIVDAQERAEIERFYNELKRINDSL